LRPATATEAENAFLESQPSDSSGAAGLSSEDKPPVTINAQAEIVIPEIVVKHRKEVGSLAELGGDWRLVDEGLHKGSSQAKQRRKTDFLLGLLNRSPSLCDYVTHIMRHLRVLVVPGNRQSELAAGLRSSLAYLLLGTPPNVMQKCKPDFVRCCQDAC
jgi:hypothetical protein